MDEVLRAELEWTRYLKRPMRVGDDGSGEQRWLKKPVLASRNIDVVEMFDRLTMSGPGSLKVDKECTVTENGSIRIDMPVKTTLKNPSNRAYAIPELLIPLDNEDISQYNRIYTRVRVENPGHHCLFFGIALNNSGEHIMPQPGRFEGTTHFSLTPGQWHHVIWEFPTIYRDCCNGFTVKPFLIGELPRGGGQLTLWIDDVRLETVEAEHVLGFDLRKDTIAYTHSGYSLNGRKQALVQHTTNDAFEIVAEDGQALYSGIAQPQDNGFTLLNFTELNKPGYYRIRCGSLTSGLFPVGEDAWLSAAWKSLNFIYSERCGYDIPGLHTQCHLDARCIHPYNGTSVSICGGWHDAADLTQDSANTMEVCWALMDLAEAAKKRGDQNLFERALEEARWGLNWVLNTRFDDGLRHNGVVIGIWTNNKVGDYDDITQTATNRAFTNFLAAGVCARAALVDWQDNLFTGWLLKCAVEDYAFAEQRLYDYSGQREAEVSRVAIAALTAVQLYKLTNECYYLERAKVHGKALLQCQQLEPRYDMNPPLCGFFYEDRTRKRILSYYHRSYEHALIEAYAALINTAPDDTDAQCWRQGIELYASFVEQTLIEPYGLISAGIYEVGDTDYSMFSHEGDRSQGAPTMEEYNAQVRNGRKLSETHYLRTFPVAYQFRGFHSTLLSKALAVMAAANALEDDTLRNIGTRQLEWVLGYNPFACSTMFGEGYDYHPLYTALLGDTVGAVPVGIQTLGNLDEPYWPMQSDATYKEVWVHSAARVMWMIARVWGLDK